MVCIRVVSFDLGVVGADWSVGLTGSEYNFFSYPDATARVINTWPGEIAYSGLEVRTA